MKIAKEAAIPTGTHEGIITRCHQTTKVFDPQKGPEPVVEVVIQPKWAKEGYTTRSVAVTFSDSGSTLGAFAKMCARIGHPVDEVDDFDPASIERTEVRFEAVLKNDFVNVKKDSIRAK